VVIFEPGNDQRSRKSVSSRDLKTAMEKAFLPEKADRVTEVFQGARQPQDSSARSRWRFWRLDAIGGCGWVDKAGLTCAVSCIKLAAGFGSGPDARILSLEARRASITALRHKFHKLYQYY
jgi:hypothetical protein